jgi:hypothetical protein
MARYFLPPPSWQRRLGTWGLNKIYECLGRTLISQPTIIKVGFQGSIKQRSAVNNDMFLAKDMRSRLFAVRKQSRSKSASVLNTL